MEGRPLSSARYSLSTTCTRHPARTTDLPKAKWGKKRSHPPGKWSRHSLLIALDKADPGQNSITSARG
jgi:hypothetical protein